MKNIKLFFLAILMFSTDLSFGQIAGSFEFEGRIRNYEVFPQNIQPGMPLVVSLHGGSETLQWYRNYTLMDEYADTSGFIIVFPAGINTMWNNGSNNSMIDNTVNDIGFISALIDTMKIHFNIAMDSIYCCGFSQGCMMTYRLACELGHRFAAVAGVGGCMCETAINENWDPIRPIPFMHFHGTEDTYVWYNGGPTTSNHLSILETLNFWIQNNNCSLISDTVSLPDIDPSDSTTVQKISFTNCSDSASIIHYKILRGGHTWPKLVSTFAFGSEGNKNRDIEANAEMWNFFKNYTNPLVNIAWTKNAEFIHTGYKPSQSDTLFIKAYTVNPQNHSVIVKAKILGTGTAHTDSLNLYDDGMHGDENPNDNIYGNSKILSGIPEDQYFVDIYTNDLTESTSQKYRKLNYFFLRKGPIVFDHYRITSPDTIPHHGDRLKFEFALRNNGLSATVNNITSQVVALDTFSLIYPQTIIQYASIPAGSTVVGNGRQYIEFNIDPFDTINVILKIDIFQYGRLEWTDTLSFTVINGLEPLNNYYPKEFNLSQNYPNPFNPNTIIEFSIPNAELVTLKIYNMLGQEVTTLVSYKLKSGTYKYTWDAGSLASGVYLYSLQTSEYLETRKMILMR